MTLITTQPSLKTTDLPTLQAYSLYFRVFRRATKLLKRFGVIHLPRGEIWIRVLSE